MISYPPRAVPLEPVDNLTYDVMLLHPFNGLFLRSTWVSQYQNGKTNVGLNEARDYGLWDAVASAGPYANNLHLAPDR